MATEHVKRVEITNLGSGESRKGYHIYFERTENPPPRDTEFEKLLSEYERTVFVLKDLVLTTEDFTGFMNELEVGARIGLVGPQYDLTAGRSALGQLRERVVRSARGQRDSYLFEILLKGAGFASVFAILAFWIYFSLPQQIKDPAVLASFKTHLAWIMPAALLHPGAALGMVFVGFVANRTFDFDKLQTFDPYHFTPTLRFVYVSLVSYVLLALLWWNVVMLGLGGYLLNNVTKDIGAGFLIGLMCGVSEAVIVELLIARLRPAERSKGP